MPVNPFAGIRVKQNREKSWYYRLDGMTMATNYKDFLGLDYLYCASCIIQAWTYPFYESNQQEAKEKLSRYSKIKSLIYAAKIFNAASDGHGYDYDKPEEYLAIAFVESKKTRDKVEQAISILKDRKSLFLH